MAISRSLGWSIVAAFALVALAVLGNALAMHDAASGASDAVERAEARTTQQAVRADLNEAVRASGELVMRPASEDLDALVKKRDADGLRYLALVGPRGRLLESAGTSVMGDLPTEDDEGRPLRAARGRVRFEFALSHNRWGDGKLRIVGEIEPVEANAMRGAARRTVGISVIAALVLLAVAAVLVRRELRRQADERAAEREKRLAALGEMSAVLAHEIKNPLASLKGNAQLLAAMLPEGEKPRAKAQRVVDEAVRLEQLTQDLLQFVRTGAIARAPGDPGALVREAAASVSPEIAVDAGAAPAAWSLDAGRIRQVLVNLLDNALAAGPPARAAVRTAGGALVLEVADHGPGVPAEDREKIFEPFHTGKTHGTGLGLAVARRIVEQHGGTITVHDAPGGGALFRVTIPA